VIGIFVVVEVTGLLVVLIFGVVSTTEGKATENKTDFVESIVPLLLNTLEATV
jgi:hypothetical protein